MNRRIYRSVRGPSWAEVILGAALSVALGVVLGAVFLVFRPVVAVKELPPEDERMAGVVYQLEGSRDPGKARFASSKKKSFFEGQSVTLTEDELNVLAGPAPAPKPAAVAANVAKGAPATTKAPAPKAPTPAPKAGATSETPEETFVRGTPVFRLRENDVQIAVPITVNALGLGSIVVVRTHGQFTKQGEVFAYEVGDMYLGSLPVHRVPFLAAYARGQFLAQPLPEELTTAWKKLAKVAVVGSSLQLTMP